MLSIHCRLIIILTIFVWLTLTLAKVCPHTRLITLYIIEKVVFTNVVKLRLPTLIRIHLVINASQVVRYRELVEEQKVEKVKLIKIEEVEE